MNSKKYDFERQRMVKTQLQSRNIHAPRVLEAFGRIPRHLFVPEEQRFLAYEDGPLSIGQGQTISQPYIVALMTQLLDLAGDETVLEIGTGSGYQAAILSQLAKCVHTIERHPGLAERASATLQKLGLTNVHVHVGDGTLGLPQFAPYSAILVTAAAPSIPQPLLDQLGDGGRLVLPVGNRGSERLELWRRHGATLEKESGLAVAFVPLIGQYGWNQEEIGLT